MLRINNYYLVNKASLFQKLCNPLLFSCLFLLFTVSTFGQGPPPPEPTIVCFPNFDFNNFTYAGNEEKYDNVTNANFREIRFNSDGTKMFILETTNNFIEQHTVYFPYDISSSSLDNDAGFSVNDQETAPTGFTFSEDGLKLFVVGTSSQRVHSYTLSSPYDITSATYDGISSSFYTGDDDNSPQGIAFNDLGDQLLVLGSENKKVTQYTLSSVFDLTSATYTAEFAVPTGMNATSISYIRSGSDMYLLDESASKIVRYGISIPIDVENAQFRGELDLSSTETSPKGFAYVYPKIAVLGSDNNAVLEFNSGLSSNYVESETNDGTIVTNNNPVIYRIINAVGNKFIDADNDGILDGGVTISNLPNGLNAVFTLNNLKNEATLQLTGTAINHDDIDDVFDLDIVFTQDSHDITLVTGFSCRTSIIVDFKDNSTASVEDILSNRVHLFTNSNKTLHLRTSNLKSKEIKIYNLLGQEVFYTKNFTPNTNEYDFSVNVKSGIYIAELTTDFGKVVKKIVFN